MHTKIALTTALYILFLQSLPLWAEEKSALSCQQTTEIALKPFRDRLQAALAGQRHHADETTAKKARLQKYIADTLATKALFDERREKDVKAHDDRIAAAEQAIRDAQKAHAEKIRKLGEARNAARKNNNEAELQRLSKAISDARALSAAGEISAYAPPLGFSKSVSGWRAFIDKQKQLRADSVAKHAAGEVAVYLGLLGYSPTWKKVLALVEKQRQLLATVSAREESFYLPSLGYSMTGEKIDQLVSERQQALADARARMAAGTFRLYIPQLGHSNDRNHVLGLIGQAKASIEKIRADWAAKKYRTYNPLVGNAVSNGGLEQQIAKLTREIADISGNDQARVYVREYNNATSGEYLKERIAAATDAKRRAYFQKMYGHWREAIAALIKQKREQMAKREAQLAKHRELWLADIKKREDDISGRLSRALAQTPCGGGDVESALVQRHTSVLDRISEDDLERDCRRARYGDGIYITADGKRHGSPRDALSDALYDTDVGTAGSIDSGEQSLEADILDLKNFTDWLLGSKDFLAEYGADIKQLQRAEAAALALTVKLDALKKVARQSKSGKKVFARQRSKILTELGSAIDELRQATGHFLRPDFDRVIKAVEDSRHITKRSSKAVQALNKLNRLRESAARLNQSRLPRFADMAADFGRVTAANIEAAESMINTVRKGELGGAWRGMSTFEKTLFIWSVAAASAEASDLMKQGKAASDAIGRAGINLTVELAIGGIPVTAAAQLVSMAVFETAYRVTGDINYRDYNVESAAKELAQSAVDQWAGLASDLGEGFGASELDALDNSASSEQIRDAIADSENRLDQLQPGGSGAAEMMRARARLRALLRAKQRAAAIRALQQQLAAERAKVRPAHGGSRDMQPVLDRIEQLEAALARRRAVDC